ncbi:hypothetical protein A2801_04040 [Candidatus Woesebacteria bacterium RIFCSPHIGHO2_01_FULL_41_10]|uniref:Copper amine oxidase-like N-terminal domain-containing protein n=1 Tax=Candidatus Woesebacteria bacterium RIFCSPHIGHO2_01_FULL_41_10 TaxID=1802500 RepID=A0A1F7YP04_9BACT|nr:MAG: hypothetical protein A2801_04040 [Candidatus Woesebacteria bacterium RIFCSPHIGHO2_01_FULL_41_10]
MRLPGLNLPQQDDGLGRFNSEEEFKTYLSQGSEALSGLGSFGVFSGGSLRNFAAQDLMLAPSAGMGVTGTEASTFAAQPQRVSDTNVQVIGVDEPDIVKTDGNTIYFSSTNYFYDTPLPVEPFIMEDNFITEDRVTSELIPPTPGTYQGPQTKVLKAFPPSELEVTQSINEYGNLLLTDSHLVVFDSNQAGISGYKLGAFDEGPDWEYSPDSNTQMVAARLYNNEIYMVMQTYVYSYSGCPMKVFETGLTVPCTDIWRPNTVVPVDTTFTIVKINPSSGSIIDSVSFVGSSGQSVVYMSQSDIFATYTYYQDLVQFMFGFLNDSGRDIVSPLVLSKIDSLRGLDISNRAKQVELEIIMDQYYSSLPQDEQVRLRNEFANRAQDYLKEHGRDLEQTGIARIAANSLDVAATGSVPGTPLNQFALDEYNENLRIATTVTASGFGNAQSVNDVYVLDAGLNKIGEVLDLGVTERVYSVRFIEDKGYLVTFRQIDPFYVLDLSNPRAPKMAGELKIPGFSSYLHPISKNLILGVGQENQNVKLSLFDVSNPGSPTEVSKYLLDEYWTEVASNHHAFLYDPRHSAFFLPAGQSGYVFSVSDNTLALERVVSDISAQRALYLDDYMYILGDTKVVVVNELDWQDVNSLTLR